MVAALVVVVLGCSALAGLGLADPAVPPVGAASTPSTVSTDPADGSVLRPGDETRGGRDDDAAAHRAVEDLLDARADALLARDREGWMSGISTAGPAAGFAQRQAAVFDDIAAVPLAQWGWELLGEGPSLPADRRAELGGDGSTAQPWVARVALVYRLSGAGGQVRREKHLTVAPSPTGSPRGWALVDDTDGPSVPDLWDLGPVDVHRGARSLVVGAGDLSGVAALADEGADRVDALWGEDWPRATVVEVPASEEQMARLLGREDASALERVAAVTTGERVGGGGASTGDRVVLNPRGFAGLTGVGALVVMTHELTHVATRASTSGPVPPWLSEGYADWVGYHGQGLGPESIAEPLLREVREAAASPQGPAALGALPGADDFDPAQDSVGQAYAGAWLAADLVARRYGEESLAGLYRDTASGARVAPGTDLLRRSSHGGADDSRERAAAADAAAEAALRRRLGLGTTAFTSAWRQHVTALAAGRS